jgi:hypothetical protein
MPAYSGTPLAKKLGIKESSRLRLINIPDNYFELLSIPKNEMQIAENIHVKKDFIHFFTKKYTDLLSLLPGLKKEIAMDGMIWVSWPKKSSKISTDLTENLIREFALEIGLVDIKVCSVDDIWSGLKLVIPVRYRTGK